MKTRLEKLKELERSLYETMGKANSRSMAALARQYRETIREIDELEGSDGDADIIAELVAKHGEAAAD